jgi:hypothetical protein
MKTGMMICVVVVMGLQAVCFGALRADINQDGRVDMLDLAILAEEWLMEEIDMNLGPELVVNGGFDTDTVWTKGNGWTIANGEAVFIGPIGQPGHLVQDMPVLVAGHTYRLIYTISNLTWDGQRQIVPNIGAEPATARYQNGTYTEDITVIISSYLSFDLFGFMQDATLNIDNVSVREVLPSGNKNNSFGPWRFGCD